MNEHCETCLRDYGQHEDLCPNRVTDTPSSPPLVGEEAKNLGNEALPAATQASIATQTDSTPRPLLECPFCACKMESRGDFTHPPESGLWTSHPRNKCILEGMWFKPELWNQRAAPSVVDDTAGQKAGELIPTNAIGHVINCKCVVCRNTNFDYIKKRKLLALFTAVREYTTERQYQNVEACRKGMDRLEREMLAALVEAENVILSIQGVSSPAAGASSLTVAGQPEAEEEELASEVARKFAQGDPSATDANLGLVVDYYYYPILAAIRKAKAAPIGKVEEGQELPAVGGRRIDCTLNFFEQRFLISLRDEQEKLLPDNRLIALYCDAVRLAREYGDAMKAGVPIPQVEEGLCEEAEKAALEFTNKANICTHAGILNLAIPVFTELARYQRLCKIQHEFGCEGTRKHNASLQVPNVYLKCSSCDLVSATIGARMLHELECHPETWPNLQVPKGKI